MSSRMVKFSFTPGENEQLETVIRLPEENRSILHGTVKNSCGKAVEDAVVKLYEKISTNDGCTLSPLTYTFTDENGQFLFGPLSPGKHYTIKAIINDVKIKDLIIYPELSSCCKDKDCPCINNEVIREYCDDIGDVEDAVIQISEGYEDSHEI